MNNDELWGEGRYASRRRRERLEDLTGSGTVDDAANRVAPTDHDARDLDADEADRRRGTAEEDRLLRDEDEARSELPR